MASTTLRDGEGGATGGTSATCPCPAGSSMSMFTPLSGLDSVVEVTREEASAVSPFGEAEVELGILGTASASGAAVALHKTDSSLTASTIIKYYAGKAGTRG